jgi:hypothetical protein
VPFFAVCLSDRFGFARAHYLEADEHRELEDRHVILREGRVAWQAPRELVARVEAFASRAEAIAFFRDLGRRLPRHQDGESVALPAGRKPGAGGLVERVEARTARRGRERPKPGG